MLLAACSAPLAEWVARRYTDDPEVIDVVVNLILSINAVMMTVWTRVVCPLFCI
ncbi:hypothetical protein P4S72_29575 [Vibrio sp. PP-XX7]